MANARTECVAKANSRAKVSTNAMAKIKCKIRQAPELGPRPKSFLYYHRNLDRVDAFWILPPYSIHHQHILIKTQG